MLSLRIMLYAVVGVYCGWSALGALRSGHILIVYPKREFSRGRNPVPYWFAVCVHLAFAVLCVSGVISILSR